MLVPSFYLHYFHWRGGCSKVTHNDPHPCKISSPWIWMNSVIYFSPIGYFMYGCKSWTIKKAEHRRIDAFELWCWRRLLRVPWTARRSNQSILKEISPGCSLEGCWSWNSNTLATWCRELTYLKRPWCWERLRAGGEGDNRRWHGWMASPTQWTWVWVNSEIWWWTGSRGVFCDSWGRKESDTTEWLNWIELYVM